ncbi:MAG: LysR family transcriptional regulator [Candidatus Sedimenticola sp. (ex Thyasira tokunagai)]
MDFASRLLLLLDVINFGSFSKVSDHRNVNRSVISKQISKLEDELGVRLLNRTTRSLSLTTAGQEVMNQARSLHTLLDETRTLAQNYHSEPIGILRLTSASYFGRWYIQKAVMAFQRKYPAIKIELRLEDRIVDLVAEGYDLGFRTGEPKDSSLIAKKLARNRLLIVASPSFLERYGEPETISELEKLPAVVYSSTGLLLDKIRFYDNQGKEAYIQLNAAYKVNELDMLTDTAIEGNMISVVTAQMIKNEILEGKLIPIMTQLHLADYGTFYAVYPHRNPPQKTRLFLDTLKELIGEQTPTWEQRILGFDKMYGRGTNSK